MIEEWRPAPGFENYEVSSLGRVRSIDHLDRLGRRRRGRILSLYEDKNRSRYRVTFSLGDGRTKSESVHIVVLKAFVGEKPSPELEGCHNNGNYHDNSVSNLRWDTSSANKFDTVKHGNHHEARKMQCLRGHPLVAGNLMSKSRGRQCRSCNAGRAAFRKGKTSSVQEYSDLWYQENVAS